MLKKMVLIFTVIFSMTTFSGIFAYGEENVVKIYDKAINKESEYVKISAKIPEVKTPNVKVGEELTKLINDRFESTVIDVTDLAKLDESKEKKFIGKYEVNELYDVTYNKNNILSLYTINYQFTGGAHGMTTLVPYNLNSKTGEKIKLNTLFKKDFDYKKYINDEVNKKISENPDIYFQDDENKFKSISDKQDFYINDNGIVINFGLYEIAPYSSGMQQVLIPKEEIVNKLNQKIW